MNSNRVPLAPLTPLQVQQLARSSKSKFTNNVVSYQQSKTQQNDLCYDINKSLSDNQVKIQRKITLELLNSIKDIPFPEFLYGVHIDYKQQLTLHIYPTTSLLKILNEHFMIKETINEYEKFYGQTKSQIRTYINISELDLILYLLSSIVKSKLDLNRNREVFRKQSVIDLVNLRKLQIVDPKLKQFLSLVQYIYNSSQIKLNGNNTLIRFEKPQKSQKDSQSLYIRQNIQQIATWAFLQYCLSNKIIIPEILLFLNLNEDEIVIDDYNFIVKIPDSQQYDELKVLIRYDRLQRITSLQSLIEFEDFLISVLKINFPLPSLNQTIFLLVNLIEMNKNSCQQRINKIVTDQKFKETVNRFSQSQNDIVSNILSCLINISSDISEVLENRIPKLKLKISKF